MACRIVLLTLRGVRRCREESAEAIVVRATTGEGPNLVLRAGTFAVRVTADIEGRMSMSTHPWAEGSSVPEQTQLMERVVERSNMQSAYSRVKQNKGAPGVDGMKVEQLGGFLRAYWPKIKERLCEGSYEPMPVRRVQIPKASGGLRPLGIPTVLDRLIQQALHQVLSPLYEPEFSEHSYGFRRGRNAHQAVLRARQYQQEGKRWVVDMDLARFFDEVNHEKLMARIGRKVKDWWVRALIPRYLQAGVLLGGVVSVQEKGTPQGGPLSPLPVEHRAGRSGPGVGATWAQLLPLCRRLQHLRRQSSQRRARDGIDYVLCRIGAEAEGQPGEERRGKALAAQVSRLHV